MICLLTFPCPIEELCWQQQRSKKPRSPKRVPRLDHASSSSLLPSKKPPPPPFFLFRGFLDSRKRKTLRLGSDKGCFIRVRSPPSFFHCGIKVRCGGLGIGWNRGGGGHILAQQEGLSQCPDVALATDRGLGVVCDGRVGDQFVHAKSFEELLKLCVVALAEVFGIADAAHAEAKQRKHHRTRAQYEAFALAGADLHHLAL